MTETVEINMVDYLACPHCGHRPNPPQQVRSRDQWGGYDWVLVCSSSHCRARVEIVADGWSEQMLHGARRDRITQLREKWNRRIAPSPQGSAGS